MPSGYDYELHSCNINNMSVSPRSEQQKHELHDNVDRKNLKQEVDF